MEYEMVVSSLTLLSTPLLTKWQKAEVRSKGAKAGVLGTKVTGTGVLLAGSLEESRLNLNATWSCPLFATCPHLL